MTVWAILSGCAVLEGLALLFGLALCRAAGRTAPRPVQRDAHDHPLDG